MRNALRYFYQIQAVAAVLWCLVLHELTRRLSARAAGAVLATCTLAALGSWMIGTPPMDHYEVYRARVALARDAITSAVAQHPPGSVVCLENQPDYVRWKFPNEPKSAFPGYAGIFLLLFPTNVVDGRRIVFVTSDPSDLATRADGERVASLIVPPGGCPP